MITPVPAVIHRPTPPRRRAQVSIRYDKYTIIDSVTGERFELEPDAAWRKFNELNGIVA